jgi:hypothetical protein
MIPIRCVSMVLNSMVLNSMVLKPGGSAADGPRQLPA